MGVIIIYDVTPHGVGRGYGRCGHGMRSRAQLRGGTGSCAPVNLLGDTPDNWTTRLVTFSGYTSRQVVAAKN